jgi:hypothetical protein
MKTGPPESLILPEPLDQPPVGGPDDPDPAEEKKNDDSADKIPNVDHWVLHDDNSILRWIILRDRGK